MTLVQALGRLDTLAAELVDVAGVLQTLEDLDDAQEAFSEALTVRGQSELDTAAVASEDISRGLTQLRQHLDRFNATVDRLVTLRHTITHAVNLARTQRIEAVRKLRRRLARRRRG